MTTSLKKGDPVIVLVGGNKKKGKVVAGQTGKILKLLPKRNRVIVEGVNFIKRHKRAMSPNESAGIIQKEGSVHISNVMYYVESLKRPVRIKFKKLDDGRKVRGYLHPKSQKFEQIDV
ncbi:MAG: 50S ribosomal protein L24 [Bdellovibrionota bacterium]